MAKVKLLIGMARTVGTGNVGDIIDVSNSEAEAMIAAGFAKIVEMRKEQVEIPEKKIKKPKTKRVKK